MNSRAIINLLRSSRIRRSISYCATCLPPQYGPAKSLAAMAEVYRNRVQPALNYGKIDPVVNSLIYKTPSASKAMYNLVFGFPIAVLPEVSEPQKTGISPITEPDIKNKTKIEAHKRDKYWRRRGMKRHRHMRWKKRNEIMLAYKEAAKAEKKTIRRANEIESIWRDAGLETEPPPLTDEQKRSLTLKWKEEGIWTEALTAQEIFAYATPPEPKNKKVLPPKNKNPIAR